MTIKKNQLLVLAEERIKDAQALLKEKRYDGAVYLCGYSVELFLKYRLCKQLKWSEFPSEPVEFKNLQSLKTHELETLLKFSGIQLLVRRRYLTEWSILMQWRPENRYQPVGKVQESDAKNMIKASQKLLMHK